MIISIVKCDSSGFGCVDFSAPFLRGEVGFMYRRSAFPSGEAKTPWGAITSVSMLNMVSLIFLVTVASGHIIWAVESHAGNTHFPAPCE